MRRKKQDTKKETKTEQPKRPVPEYFKGKLQEGDVVRILFAGEPILGVIKEVVRETEEVEGVESTCTTYSVFDGRYYYPVPRQHILKKVGEMRK